MGLDHIGFKVERGGGEARHGILIGENPHMHGRPLGTARKAGEAEAFQKCPLGCFHLTDVEGVSSTWR